MKYLDLSFSNPAANLACDEALLDECEAGRAGECLRCWLAEEPFVVVGYANRVEQEVDLAACKRRNIPVLRRCSGGGTVVQGPGCLNYALVLRIEEHGRLANISGTNRYIMGRQQQVFSELLGRPVQIEGHTDLALDGRKFSGNAQRRKREAVLFHGSVLLCFDLTLIQEVLPLPSKQPDYRQNRSHADFLRNLELDVERVKQALATAWSARPDSGGVPSSVVDQLVHDKYSQDSWNRRF